MKREERASNLLSDFLETQKIVLQSRLGVHWDGAEGGYPWVWPEKGISCWKGVGALA